MPALLGAASIALASWGGLKFWLEARSPALPRRPLTITGGSALAQRNQITRLFIREAGRQGLDLRLVDSAGSIDSAQRVDSGLPDFALIQGGLDYGEFPRLRLVAPLHTEALHLLVRRSLVPENDPNRVSISHLVGKRLGVGGSGAGTHALALEILEYAGLWPEKDYQLEEQTLEELAKMEGEPPDAVFLVSMPHSRLIRDLVRRHDYLLVPLPFAEAFSTDDLDISSERVADRLLPRVMRRHLEPTTIPAYSYEIDPPVPDRPLPTLGMRLLLVTSARTPDAVVDLMIHVAYHSPFAQAVRPSLTDRLMESPPEIPWHAAALAYKERNQALITADAIDLVEKEFSILGAILSISGTLILAYLSLRQWARQWARRRRSLRFETYIAQVVAIERRVLTLELEQLTPLPLLLELQRELGKLKAEALERFVHGEIEGEDLLLGFLAQVNDARDYLTRLILHERDNLEDQEERERLTHLLIPHQESEHGHRAAPIDSSRPGGGGEHERSGQAPAEPWSPQRGADQT